MIPAAACHWRSSIWSICLSLAPGQWPDQGCSDIYSGAAARKSGLYSEGLLLVYYAWFRLHWPGDARRTPSVSCLPHISDAAAIHPPPGARPTLPVYNTAIRMTASGDSGPPFKWYVMADQFPLVAGWNIPEQAIEEQPRIW